jgi:hypothetical protein
MDIFGKNPEDYQVVEAMKEAKTWDRYQHGNAQLRPGASPKHDFNALQQSDRAVDDASAVGYLTNNLLAIQTMADEIMYTAYRLPDFIYLNTSIPEGAQSYGIRVRDRVGRAARVSGPGWDAPSATASETIVTQPMHLYGLDAEWSIDELRGAMMAGVPLDTESVSAAVEGTMETMEAVGLTGGGYAENGLVNQPITGTDAVTQSTSPALFSASTAQAIRTIINGELSAVIEDSRETIGRNVNTGMTVYLPGTQYDLLSDFYIGDNAERTLLKSIMEDNPWNNFTGQQLTIARVLELDSALNPGSTVDRMVVALKHPRVAEMGVSISPRVLRIMDKGRVVVAQVEAKFSPLFVKRPTTVPPHTRG